MNPDMTVEKIEIQQQTQQRSRIAAYKLIKNSKELKEEGTQMQHLYKLRYIYNSEQQQQKTEQCIFFSLCNVFLSLHYYRVLFVSFSFE